MELADAAATDGCTGVAGPLVPSHRAAGATAGRSLLHRICGMLVRRFLVRNCRKLYPVPLGRP